MFFIFPLSEAVYLRSFGGMSECYIFSIVFNTHTYTDTLFIAIYMYVLSFMTYMHLRINQLIFWKPEYVKGYLINPFMASTPDDHSFNPLPTKSILKVVNSFMARAP